MQERFQGNSMMSMNRFATPSGISYLSAQCIKKEVKESPVSFQ